MNVSEIIVNAKNQKNFQNSKINLAEKEGFEPSIRDKPYTPLAGERLQPLGHFSELIL